MSRILSWSTLLLVLSAAACALETEGRANVIARPDGGYGSTSGDAGDPDAGWGYAALAETPATDEPVDWVETELAAGGAGGTAGAAY
jgi:hypothetical protein